MNIALYRKGEEKPYILMTGEEFGLKYAAWVRNKHKLLAPEERSVIETDMSAFLATYEEEPKEKLGMQWGGAG